MLTNQKLATNYPEGSAFLKTEGGRDVASRTFGKRLPFVRGRGNKKNARRPFSPPGTVDDKEAILRRGGRGHILPEWISDKQIQSTPLTLTTRL